jgi:hypothetical protein
MIPLEQQVPTDAAENTTFITREAWQDNIDTGSYLGALALGDNMLTIKNLSLSYHHLIPEIKEAQSAVLKIDHTARDPKSKVNIETLTSESQRILAEKLPQLLQSYREKIISAVASGSIPEIAIGRMDAAIKEESIWIAEPMILGVITNGCNAAYDSEHNKIYVDLIDHETDEEIEDSVYHELTHKISGGSFTKGGAESSKLQRRRTGFSNVFENDSYTNTGLNEAITQHIAASLVSGRFETIDPSERGDGNIIYYDYRKVLAVFIDRSKGIIQLETIIGAYFEDTQPGGSVVYRRQLVKQMNQAYGIGAIKKLNDLMDLTDKGFAAEVVIRSIQPPEIDAQGSVVKKGNLTINTQSSE